MTDEAEHNGSTPKPEKDRAQRTGRWATAAGMGIGSAALVAALLYAKSGRDKKPKS